MSGDDQAEQDDVPFAVFPQMNTASESDRLL